MPPYEKLLVLCPCHVTGCDPLSVGVDKGNRALNAVMWKEPPTYVQHQIVDVMAPLAPLFKVPPWSGGT